LAAAILIPALYGRSIHLQGGDRAQCKCSVKEAWLLRVSYGGPILDLAIKEPQAGSSVSALRLRRVTSDDQRQWRRLRRLSVSRSDAIRLRMKGTFCVGGDLGLANVKDSYIVIYVETISLLPLGG
jgi:hypothetical protein